MFSFSLVFLIIGKLHLAPPNSPRRRRILLAPPPAGFITARRLASRI